jgi:UDP:flavonoid glycosyltransferase YjiC (YdhE family)
VRVLFSCVPGAGHLNPLLPLAHAFAGSGHEVAFTTSPYFADPVRAEGFPFFPAGMDGDERRARFAPYQAELQAMPVTERRGLLFPRMFGTIEAPAKLPALREIVRTWRPDLLIHESADLAAPIAAAEADVPSANHSFGLLVPLDILARAAMETERLWDDVGLPPEPFGGAFRGVYVDIAPPSLQSETVPKGVRIERLRPMPVQSSEPTLEWIEELPDRPTVYATLGTVFNELPVFRVLLDALAEVECNVIATIGRNGDPAALEPIPANARVERYVPQSLLLPHCSAVVSHAGSGTLLASLAAGLPLLLVPQSADQFDNAAQAAGVGAALALMPDELTAEAARAATVSLLEEEPYRHRARRVAEEISAMPSPEELVPVLVAFAAA